MTTEITAYTATQEDLDEMLALVTELREIKLKWARALGEDPGSPSKVADRLMWLHDRIQQRGEWISMSAGVTSEPNGRQEVMGAMEDACRMLCMLGHSVGTLASLPPDDAFRFVQSQDRLEKYFKENADADDG